jgi:prepilin-type N-terminal cleavage/methylation domain-containing protein
MTRRRAGFTLVELMVVVTIIGLIARIAVPKLNAFRTRARASHIVNDLETIRSAAFHFAADSGRWPEDVGMGTVPPGIVQYLPPALTFNPDPGIVYGWRLTGMPGGDPGQATEATTMGMGAQVDDDDLRAELQRQLSGQESLVSSGVTWWLIWSPNIRP